MTHMKELQEQLKALAATASAGKYVARERYVEACAECYRKIELEEKAQVSN